MIVATVGIVAAGQIGSGRTTHSAGEPMTTSAADAVALHALAHDHLAFGSVIREIAQRVVIARTLHR